MFNLIVRCIIGAIIGALIGWTLGKAPFAIERALWKLRVKRAHKSGELA